MSSKLVNDPIVDGIDPTKQLLCNNKVIKAVKDPTVDGIEPKHE